MPLPRQRGHIVQVHKIVGLMRGDLRLEDRLGIDLRLLLVHAHEVLILECLGTLI